ncbi:hypothetical protein Amet_2595 [Alkaliphilus metalliredigens QYMF]|uniref:Uncharacterized protein n=1 Tax=Alkaliphilus metalliredigens (strain QYMF) TaxID=293826 RepID=A6TRC9_ALKMQ|nr:hypothetical protein [Alkaliphilus metalliredigens]ABR48747.1 hypothetical protein Amet_2595 [Alkaliphilus metalliredigens QYMF]
MKYKNDKFEITGLPEEINTFLHLTQMKDKEDRINTQQERIRELALSNTQLRDHEEKLIENLNIITAEKTTLSSELERYKQLAMIREQEIEGLKRELDTTKRHNYKLHTIIEESDEIKKGMLDKLTIARDRELDCLAELIYQERHDGEDDEQLRKRILRDLKMIK